MYNITARLKDGQLVTAEEGEFWVDGPLLHVQGKSAMAVFPVTGLELLRAEPVDKGE